MLVAALVIGVVTRISYGDVSAHPETMDGLPYEVAPYSQERFEQYAKGMGDASTAQALSNAELVARVQKKASSIYRYKAFASEMRVMEVLRGDDCLQGVSIDVYEPVSLRDWGWNEVSGCSRRIPVRLYSNARRRGVRAVPQPRSS